MNLSPMKYIFNAQSETTKRILDRIDRVLERGEVKYKRVTGFDFCISFDTEEVTRADLVAAKEYLKAEGWLVERLAPMPNGSGLEVNLLVPLLKEHLLTQE